MAAVEMAFFLCLSISSNMRLLFLLKFLSDEESSSEGFVSVEMAGVEVSSSPLEAATASFEKQTVDCSFSFNLSFSPSLLQFSVYLFF